MHLKICSLKISATDLLIYSKYPCAKKTGFVFQFGSQTTSNRNTPSFIWFDCALIFVESTILTSCSVRGKNILYWTLLKIFVFNFYRYPIEHSLFLSFDCSLLYYMVASCSVCRIGTAFFPEHFKILLTHFKLIYKRGNTILAPPS